MFSRLCEEIVLYSLSYRTIGITKYFNTFSLFLLKTLYFLLLRLDSGRHLPLFIRLQIWFFLFFTFPIIFYYTSKILKMPLLVIYISELPSWVVPFTNEHILHLLTTDYLYFLPFSFETISRSSFSFLSVPPINTVLPV